VHRALAAVVARRSTLVFLDEQETLE